MLNKTYFVFQDRSERHSYWRILRNSSNSATVDSEWSKSSVLNLAVQHFFYFYILYVIFLQYFSVQPDGRRPFRLTSGDNVNVAP